MSYSSGDQCLTPFERDRQYVRVRRTAEDAFPNVDSKADAFDFDEGLAVTWVVLSLCQLAVTVAGNLAVLPLTGVTFPFVSFGMTSLCLNMAMLALCLNLNVPQRRSNG